jgi:predicted O-linked N-acetylglucosamine transferase (SPINDLY family)
VLDAAWGRVEETLDELAAGDFRLDDPVACWAPFALRLASRDANLRPLQLKAARAFVRAAPSLAAPVASSRRRRRRGRPRIGFIAAHAVNHAHALLAGGLIERLSPSRFEVVVLRLPHPVDDLVRAIRAIGDQRHMEAVERVPAIAGERTVALPASLAEARAAVAALELDAVVHVDVGSHALTYFLACSRLAPVQCALWGMPFTTGLPAIDFFLSGRGAEPADADGHYSERLVAFENLPTYFRRPALETQRSREDLGLDSGVTLYVCPQTPAKFSPESASLLVRVLDADPKGQLVLIGGDRDSSDALEGLAATAPDRGRVRILPRLSRDDYLGLLALADVVLDTTPYCGSVTTHDALALGAPVVTLPGRFLRGRITAACYGQMKLDGPVARDADEYVTTAIELGTNRSSREDLRRRIRERGVALYENDAPVREVEDFLACAVVDAAP